MMRWILLLSLLLVGPALAQDSVKRISSFSDPYGNLASFWVIQHSGQRVGLLKVKSPDHEHEADVVLDSSLVKELESRFAELKRSPNRLKNDGFEVLWSQSNGDAKVSTLLGCHQGLRVKILQVTQKKEGEPERQHHVTLDEAYPQFQSAWQKFKRAL